MRFDMNNIHTIFESAKSKNCVPSEHADKSGSKIDATLGDSDLIGLFDNICPICGDVFASMKDAAADPKNLKLTMVKTEDLGEATKIYIEAVEFATFCEAADLNIGEAAEEILDTCNGMVPGSNDSELHVVFPSEALNKGELGSTRFGRDVRNDWAMQLLTGCRRYGIHVNSGVEDGEPVTESAYKKAMNEAASKNPLGYEACIKRDKALIEREVNAASKEVYKTFKDNISSHYEKYMDEFYKKNKTAPKFDGLTHETDLYAIELSTNAYVDICLFYQDRVCKLLNKSEKLKALGYKFETEDYPGIFIRNAAAQAIKEAAEDVNDESIEEGFGRHGFRDVKPLRDDKDGNKDDDKFTTRSDGSKWQNSIDLPDDNGGWVDSIKLDEAATENTKNKNDDGITVNGKKIPIVRESNSDDANKDYEVFKKNWKSILNYIARNTYEYYKEYCSDDEPVMAWKKPADVIPDMVFSKIWFGEPKPTRKFDCLTSVEVRYDLKSEVLKYIHDDHVPDCHVYIKDHKFRATDDFFDIMYDG